MTGRDYLWCALNLLLDQEEELAELCPSCRAEAQEGHCPVCGGLAAPANVGENQSFDRFPSILCLTRPGVRPRLRKSLLMGRFLCYNERTSHRLVSVM